MRSIHESNSSKARGVPMPRRFAALLVIIAATGVRAGPCLRQPTQMGANDISRWCTVWSLLERGSYVIDECPWQVDTQDKVFRAPREPDGAGRPEPVKHYYSSKPALLADLDRRDPLSRSARDGRAARPSRAPGAGPAVDSEARPRLARTGSRACSRRPRTPSDGRSTSSTSSRSWCS